MARRTNTVYTSRRRQNSINSASYGRNLNTTIFEPNEKLGKFSQVLLFGGMIAVIALIFLNNANKPAYFSSEFQEEEKALAELKVKANNAEVENARLTSIRAIQDSEVAKKMTTPVSIKSAK